MMQSIGLQFQSLLLYNW